MGKFSATASNKEAGTYERPPTGLHPARLVGLIDLGTHTRTFADGKTGDQHKIYFIWELTHEADSKGKNFVVAADFSWSLHKASNLRPVIEKWTDRPLRDNEGFDFDTLFDVPCMVDLSKKNPDKDYVSVTAVTKVYKGLAVEPATLPRFEFALGDHNSSAVDPEIPEWVPKLFGRGIADEIKASKEWQSLPGF